MPRTVVALLRLATPGRRAQTAWLALALLPWALSACASSPAPPASEPAAAAEPSPSRPPAPLRCQAEAARAALLGQPADPAAVERARRDAGGDVVRVLKPGQAITKEYRDGRVNVYVDEANAIIDVTCG